MASTGYNQSFYVGSTYEGTLSRFHGNKVTRAHRCNCIGCGGHQKPVRLDITVEDKHGQREQLLHVRPTSLK